LTLNGNAVLWGIVDLGYALFEDVSNERWELPTGVHLSVGQHGHEIERSSAPEAGAPAEEFCPLFMAHEVEQIIFKPEDGIDVASVQILFQERSIFFLRGSWRAAPSPTCERRLKVKRSARP